MQNIHEVKRVNRRRFLRQAAVLGGLVVGGSVGLTACGDNPTNTALPTVPTATATSAPTATSVPATATSPAKTSAAPVTTKAAATTPPTTSAKLDPNFVDAGAIKDFSGATTEPKLVDLSSPRLKKATQVFVVKQGEQYNALSNICTHQGCEVDWVGTDSRFECPCHGSQFNLEGDNVAGPAPLPLATYATKVENGRLLISIKKQ